MTCCHARSAGAKRRLSPALSRQAATGAARMSPMGLCRVMKPLPLGTPAPQRKPRSTRLCDKPGAMQYPSFVQRPGYALCNKSKVCPTMCGFGEWKPLSKRAGTPSAMEISHDLELDLHHRRRSYLRLGRCDLSGLRLGVKDSTGLPRGHRQPWGCCVASVLVLGRNRSS